MTDDDGSLMQRNSYSYLVSRDQLVAEGHLEPTEAERIDMRDRYRRYAAESVEDWKVQQAAEVRLETITDSRSLLVLDHHSADDRGRCRGCDPGEYAADGAEWPCSSVRMVASWNAIDMPSDWQDREPRGPEAYPDDWTPGPPLRIRDLFPQSFVTMHPITFPTTER